MKFKSNFDMLCEKLIEHGYELNIKKYDNYKFANIKGKGIFGGFASPHDENLLDAEYYYNGIVTIDNVNCWDKARNAPLHMKIPQNQGDFEILLDRLKFWASRCGRIKSNNFEKDDLSLNI